MKKFLNAARRQHVEKHNVGRSKSSVIKLLEGTTHPVNISAIPSGFYFLKLKQENGSFSTYTFSKQ